MFVNDGSTDGTIKLLDELSRHRSNRLTYLHLPKNVGKAEAVRCGLLHALGDAEARYIGYLDADLSTPWQELPAFVTILDQHPQVAMVLGARVKLLGRLIHRRALRHYLGRVFATLASMVLGIAVYDTQCGAKVLRADPFWREVLDEPFRSRWIFDVEIIARLARVRGIKGAALADALIEQPLREWQDVAGSKVKGRDFFVALVEILQIHATYGRHLRS